ncbi:hypothetical protein ACFQ4N_15765 [Oceanobacillus iheyensis]|uniref:Uncharacterized protein n=1 Tax=Oceanobacillus iheyensis (strain DSM 14371 / CIP 107618 / JCM 11309 / KCTC 3954 / HTE831) TaxID=221109 RepID=Q8ELD5_OCEIH|nr:hypothetical protein [Oceanobacillus iheyensis]BAC15250.1 hypothetical protein [Oceanobacillus iheyensis HTE831]
MKKIAIYTAIISIIGVLVIIVLGETFEISFMMGQIMTAFAAVLFLLSLAAFFFLFFLQSKKKFQKIILFIISAFFMCVCIVSVDGVVNVYQDKEAYDKKDLATIQGVPDRVLFESNSYVDNPSLSTIEMEGTSFDTLHLWIEEDEYNEKYQNQQLEIQYLPESKIVVDIYIVESQL